MRTSLTSLGPLGLLVRVTLACGLAFAADAQSAGPGAGTGLSLGRVIALQGNKALRDIREDARHGAQGLSVLVPVPAEDARYVPPQLGQSSPARPPVS